VKLGLAGTASPLETLIELMRIPLGLTGRPLAQRFCNPQIPGSAGLLRALC
jgi:hypothetical protein